jgi:hypothetical protein
MERSMQRGMDKRKVCVFLILVGAGILCVCLMLYALFLAKPRTNPMIEKGGHSSLRYVTPVRSC